MCAVSIFVPSVRQTQVVYIIFELNTNTEIPLHLSVRDLDRCWEYFRYRLEETYIYN